MKRTMQLSTDEYMWNKEYDNCDNVILYNAEKPSVGLVT